ncbi:polymorphic toxin-type HINT domain-containing protein [Streptomyces yaizuensis]|uniref:HNH endonuclease n=1 Tax=Streptomyces yaizuensis TaxID=2989713 RepID=A0ABQ5NRN1_9ACTN|nr:polymorphic toxin-type HINT domain-containing protein [Streptomyces sp. YSPA8]GLF93031.1 HNH endonuclease [Streptomyces sp. YSPA8]
MKPPLVRLRRTLLRRTTLALSTVMIATVIQGVTFPAEAGIRTPPPLPGVPSAEKPIAGSFGTTSLARADWRGPQGPRQAPPASWPTAGGTTVTVARAGSGVAVRSAQAQKGLIRVTAAAANTAGKQQGSTSAARRTAPATVETHVLDRKQTERAGVKGVLFTLEPGRGTTSAQSGPVDVALDYADFAGAFGGSYASRLRLVELPACALTNPAKDACHTAKPLPTGNDTARKTLTTQSVAMRVGTPTVLAAMAAPEGDRGTYKATSLASSASWKTNLNTGDFTWSYSMPVPSVPGGLVPKIGLHYASGSIDGRTGNSNNQASWVGDGFDLSPGSIERRYKPCSEDGVENADGSRPGDLCWAYDNAFLSFNGKGGELVPVNLEEGTFKLKNDDGTKVQRLFSPDRGNGDKDGEYWLLTTPDGVEYYFGYNRLPGWTEGKEATNSTWTVPVFGNDAGDECNGTDFAKSWCQQGWRWNLDYVRDPHGNVITYHYDKEENSYGRNLKSEDDTPYTRSGYLKRVDYGLKVGRVYTDKPLAQVDFESKERCLPEAGVTCLPDTIKDKAFHWFDTPWDLNCAAGSTCDKGRLSPSFWSRKRLTGVTTQTLNASGGYDRNDSWKLGHRWGRADVDYQLILTDIQRTGHTAAPAVTLPRTTLHYTQLENRLDKSGDGYAPFIKERLSTIDDEMGGKVSANYSAAVCDWNALPTPERNTTRCYPQYLGGDATSAAETHWFNKYVVTSVTTSDRTRSGAPDAVTRYEYLGDAAWAFDKDDGLSKEKERTWSQWRGYGHIRVQSGGQGGATAMKSQQDTYYLRGMHGDRAGVKPEDGTKLAIVNLGEGEGLPITDHEALAGFSYKSIVFDQPGGKVLSKTVSRPWHHETAKKERSWGTVTANFTGSTQVKGWESLDSGAGAKWRTNSTENSYDTVAGRLVKVDDLGDDATAEDDQCVRTTYPTGTSAILSLPSRVETVAKACAAPTDRTKDVITDVRMAYDGKPYDAAPVKGDATARAVLKKRDAAQAVYLETGSTYDGYGRVLTSTDLTADVTVPTGKGPTRTARTDGRTNTTVYIPASGLPTQVRATTPPADTKVPGSAQTSTQSLGARGLPVRVTDTNGNVTEQTYDALGRSSKVWLADRSTTELPSHEFVYHIQDGKPSVVVSKTINNTNGQISSQVLYDGLLRERQTQSPGPNGGTILTDVFYDNRGNAVKTFAPYYTTQKAKPELFTPDEALSVETQTLTTYDGLGRETQVRQIAGNSDGGAVLSTTTTAYEGDRTTIVPPTGGTTITNLLDGRGRISEVRQHHERSADSAYDSTRYRYHPSGQLSTLTSPSGATWSYDYDQLGRPTESSDPDKGITKSSYDDRGQLLSTTDARSRSLHHIYDNLGRKTELREGSATGTVRAKWVYDTVSQAKGQLAESIRYHKDQAYISRVTAYDRLYRPTRTAVVIPGAEGDLLKGTYQNATAFKPSGLTASVSYSAAGGLPGGAIVTAHDDILRPVGIAGDGVSASIAHSLTGKPLQYTMNRTDGKKVQVTNTFEWGTQRLATSRVDREEQNGVDRHVTYRYDDAGNVRSMADVSRTGTDNQCFAYDHLARLTEAWTQSATTCATAPATDKIGGPAPYWHSYRYNKASNRATEILHDPAGQTANDITRSYTYPKAGEPRPHSLLSVSSTGPAPETRNYGYDAVGNTETRPGQNLEWDIEGRLAKVTEGSKVTEYLYDAEGNRLIGRTPTETTLYLGHTEITLPKGATATKATRYVPIGSGHTAVQNNDRTHTFTIADHHGTGQLAINAFDLSVSQRRSLPFGGIRGDAPASWPGSKGFVGGTDDTKATGLTHLGAREYDPAIGRFISVDPLLQTSIPHTLNGYSYAAQNPMTSSDPSGLGVPECHTGVLSKCNNGAPTKDSGYHPEREPSTCVKDCYSGEEAGTGGGGGSGGGGHGGAANMGGGGSGGGGGKSKGFLDGAWALGRNIVEIPSEVLYGGISSAAHTSELFGWTFDGDCWNGGAGAPGCDYGTQWDNYIGEHGVDTGSAGYQLAGLVGTLLGRKPMGKPSTKTKTNSRCPNSFLAGTAVLMADGTTKDIEDVEVGDMVMALDPEKGEWGSRAVTHLIRTDADRKLNKLSIATEGGVQPLIATDEHPFWSPSERRWVNAVDLKAGMTLLTNVGTTVLVTANRAYAERVKTYNLTVDDLHTYYVVSGGTALLVHNANCTPNPGTRFDVPNTPGIYTIHLNDGSKYVGSSISSKYGMRDRVNKSMRSKHSVAKSGYGPDDVENVTYFELPAGISKTVARRIEQTMMEGYKENGVTLVNTKDPEIPVATGGYLP